MSSVANLEQARREEVRWRLLRGLDVGRPYPVSETILFRLLHEVKLPVSPMEVRRELDYLRDRKLITLSEDEVWSAELTRYGVDIVEYTIDCEPGIARPPRG